MPGPTAEGQVSAPGKSEGGTDAGAPARIGADRWPRWAVIGIFLIAAVAAVAAARDFLMPVILAFLLALVFTPLRRSLNRVGLPSWVCAVLVIGTLSASIGIGVLMLSGSVSDWVRRAPQIGIQVESKIRSLREPVAEIAEAGKKIDKLAEAATETSDQSEAPKVEVKQAGLTARVAALMPLIAAQGAFVLVLLFFLIASGDMFYEKLVHIMPTLTDKRRALRIAFDIERRLARYLSTIALINALLGTAVGTAMWAIGMPSPVLFALLAFLLNFMPYVGAVIGIALATVIGLVSFDEPWRAVLAGGTYFALTTVEGQFITPYFVGRILRLNTVVVFISIAFWAWMWSAVGMIIAVPMLVVARVFAEHIEALWRVGDFLTARGEELHSGETEAKEPPASPAPAPGE